jgi:hypothetical protein
MIGYIVLSVGIGVLLGMTLAAWLDRATAKAPPTNATHGVSALGFDMNGTGGTEVDPLYQRMLTQVLERLDGGAGFKTVLPP